MMDTSTAKRHKSVELEKNKKKEEDVIKRTEGGDVQPSSSSSSSSSSTTTTTTTTTALSTELYFVLCVVGIYVFYLLYGLIQEQINALKFGEEKIVFGKYTAFLLTVQSLVNYFSAKVYQVVKKEEADKTPFHEYGLSALLIVISTFLSNTAIRYISYPTQVLAKSCKPIPVLLMGVFFYRRKYPPAKYFIVAIITLGVSLFMFPSTSKKSNKLVDMDDGLVMYGNLILLFSLLLDGIIGPFQENYVKKYSPSANSMMLNTNLWNTIFMAIIAILNGELLEALNDVFKYPEVLPSIFYFCITSALGQHFIFMTTNRFGALTCTTITTTRKFFSILVSIFWFGHPISWLQWLAIAMVFFGLLLDVYQSYLKSPKQSISLKIKDNNKSN